MAKKIKSKDASGRGVREGFEVSFPARLHQYKENEIKAVVDVMRSEKGLTQGEYLERFETDFERYTGVPYAFAVDNCTNALRLAAIITGIGMGDEVIIPAYTFCATAIPFVMSGAKVVWADSDPDTWLISVRDVERKITQNTKVIVIVHLLGHVVDMDPIMEIARKHNVFVVEDCAQAPGAMYKGKSVGTIGDFGCFSFHGAKNMTTLGEGGMLVVKDDKYAQLVPGLRHNGVYDFEEDRERYWIPAMSNVDITVEGIWPNNFCLGEPQCALGSELLKRLDAINNTLTQQAKYLREGLADVPEIKLPKILEYTKPVHHVVVGRFDGSRFGKNREDFMDIMTKEYRIRLIVQYYPLYRYPLFKKMGFGSADCPNLEFHWDNSFSYPWWHGIDKEILDYYIDSTKKTIQKLKKK